ncbi:MAG: hypothetical protein RR357_04345 [Clostridia bacterium]
MLYAVIDIGSTSVRVMLTNGKLVEKQIETTRLADNMSEGGNLQPQNIERTAQAVAEYYYYAIGKGADVVFAYATEAVRSAKNRGVFLNRIKELCGVEIEVLSKKTEATIGFRGAYCDGSCCVIDMGGASTELTVGDKNGIIYSVSIPYGIVRLTNIENKGVDLFKFLTEALKSYGKIPPFEKVIAIGGTAGTMASILNKLVVYDANVTNGCVITLAQIDELYAKLKPMLLEERKKVVGLSEKRADIVTSGLLMYSMLLKKLGAASLSVSEGDNMEGYLINKGLLEEGFKAVYGAI